MEIKNTEIILGQGFDEIKFGITRDNLEQLFGAPDEVEEFATEESEDAVSEAWHYDEPEISFSFDKEDDWKLGTVSVSNADFTLNGKNVFGLNKENLLATLKELDITDLEEEKWLNEDGDDGIEQELVSSLDKSINFWLTGGVVTEIQWGPFYNDEGPIWA